MNGSEQVECFVDAGQRVQALTIVALVQSIQYFSCRSSSLALPLLVRDVLQVHHANDPRLNLGRQS